MSIAVDSADLDQPGRRRRRSSKPSTPQVAERNSSSPDSMTPPPSSDSAPPSPMKVYVARKKMRVNGKWLLPGDVVPEAQEWPRVESMVRAGFLDEETR